MENFRSRAKNRNHALDVKSQIELKERDKNAENAHCKQVINSALAEDFTGQLNQDNELAENMLLKVDLYGQLHLLDYLH